MNSYRLSQEVSKIIKNCTERIMSTGQEQYENDGVQRFEELSNDELIEELVDEIDDSINYLCMLRIKLVKLRGKVNELHEKVGG